MDGMDFMDSMDEGNAFLPSRLGILLLHALGAGEKSLIFKLVLGARSFLQNQSLLLSKAKKLELQIHFLY